jgi:hypothetical protein
VARFLKMRILAGRKAFLNMRNMMCYLIPPDVCLFNRIDAIFRTALMALNASQFFAAVPLNDDLTGIDSKGEFFIVECNKRTLATPMLPQ